MSTDAPATDQDPDPEPDTDSVPEPDPEETVWVVSNRGSTTPRRYHVDRDCHQLTASEDSNIFGRPFRAVDGWREMCTTCGEGRDLSKAGSPQLDCPFCGANEKLAFHLPCEEAPTETSTPEASDSVAAPRPTSTSSIPRRPEELETGTDWDNISHQCDREGCENPRPRGNLYYCSRECRDYGTRERIELTCELCGRTKEILPHQSDQRFCSPGCAKTHRQFVWYKMIDPGALGAPGDGEDESEDESGGENE